MVDDAFSVERDSCLDGVGHLVGECVWPLQELHCNRRDLIGHLCLITIWSDHIPNLVGQIAADTVRVHKSQRQSDFPCTVTCAADKAKITSRKRRQEELPMSSIDEHTSEQVTRANASGRTPVVFIHGLWLLASSWDRWGVVFDEAGYAPVLAGWPDDPDTVKEGNDQPTVFAGKTVGQVADHYAEVIDGLEKKPAVIGHSFGGLLTQIVAGRGLAAASVAIDAAPFRGVLPLPISSLRAAKPVLGNPANRHRAVPLTYDQFRFAFANAVSEDEARELFDTFVVPASGVPLFQAAAANLNPWSEVKVDTHNPDRGPLLIVSGEKDNIVPRSIAEASYKQQLKNSGTTEFVEVSGRGHALTIDGGWREVAHLALAFVRRFV